MDADILPVDPWSVDAVKVPVQCFADGVKVPRQCCPDVVFAFSSLVAQGIDENLVPEQRAVDAELLRRRQGDVYPDT